MSPSFLHRLKSKVRSLQDRRRKVYCPTLPESQDPRAQTRSEIAAEILLREKQLGADLSLVEGEEKGEVKQLVVDDAASINTELFPDFDSSIDPEAHVEDIFANVSAQFWKGRQRSWSWASNATCVEVSDQRRREQEGWPLSLKPVANPVTGEVIYAPVPFFLCPGYYEEDPPLCEFSIEVAFEQGEYSDDSNVMDEALHHAFTSMSEDHEWDHVDKNLKWRFIDVVASKKHHHTVSTHQKGRSTCSRPGCDLGKSKRQELKRFLDHFWKSFSTAL
ncbi:hypothetical protein PFICI_12438 [Pestalotiopsis fici W106-1]|uniref:Uncharacterized protein n=1 Tax=Pestalotiopsis fici (strain W106-1 / CGMCC3.15140) TaxID=1229662 RepID=W3WNX3_PESFW|nr:uncharacterized protein PFICI_12438 [Pestalotiopsis fici W106-1]ETS75494.1 hypothetical protein PFICI_12438 [Pestalotiopsis fici W106-1]